MPKCMWSKHTTTTTTSNNNNSNSNNNSNINILEAYEMRHVCCRGEDENKSWVVIAC